LHKKFATYASYGDAKIRTLYTLKHPMSCQLAKVKDQSAQA